MNSGGDERYGCVALVWIDGDPYLCGLAHGHHGGHVPFVGDYLPPPILHPLATINRCPVCGQWCRPERGGPVLVMRHFEGGEWLPGETEFGWLFQPCGHEAREIAANA